MKNRKELLFQGHILDSYKAQGGHGRKWATELLVGAPDLIVTLPKWGLHLVEVKHRPDWANDKEYKNPLTDKQMLEAQKYLKGGSMVLAYVVIGSTDAIGSFLCAFHPLHPTVTTARAVPYVRSEKYNIKQLLENYHG